MAHDEIRIVYELMDDMSKAFNQSVEQLQDTNQEMQMIATTFEDGALLGMLMVATAADPHVVVTTTRYLESELWPDVSFTGGVGHRMPARTANRHPLHGRSDDR